MAFIIFNEYEKPRIVWFQSKEPGALQAVIEENGLHSYRPLEAHWAPDPTGRGKNIDDWPEDRYLIIDGDVIIPTIINTVTIHRMPDEQE